MKKNNLDAEIDLLDLLIFIGEKKFYLFSIVIISLIVTYISYTNNQNFKSSSKYRILTEIRPISSFEEAEYKIYNSFLKTSSFGQNNIKSSNLEKKNFNINNKDFTLIDNQQKKLSVVDEIDKQFLYDLFLDKISQFPFLIKLIKKFNYLKKEDYPNQEEYEDAVIQLASNIKVINQEITQNDMRNSKVIEFNTSNPQKWEKFLEFIDKELNSEVQKNLLALFNNYLDYQNKLQKFYIEDIDAQLSLNLKDEEIDFLKNKKSELLLNTYNKRLKQIITSSPIFKSDKFYSAKIIYYSSNYEVEDEVSIIKMLSLVGLISLIVSIFILLIIKAIRKRV